MGFTMARRRTYKTGLENRTLLTPSTKGIARETKLLAKDKYNVGLCRRKMEVYFGHTSTHSTVYHQIYKYMYLYVSPIM